MAGPNGGDLFISVTGSGDTTLLAAPGANLFVRVLGYNLTSDRPTVVTFKSGSTPKDGTYATFGSGGGQVVPEDAHDAAFDCGLNEALVLNSSVQANVIGRLRFVVKGGVINQV